MISAPRMAPEIVPTPPASAVPPITAAAIVWSSSSVPRSLPTALRRAVAITAAMAASAPISTKIFTVSSRVLMPESSAASGLPPVAKT